MILVISRRTRDNMESSIFRVFLATDLFFTIVSLFVLFACCGWRDGIWFLHFLACSIFHLFSLMFLLFVVFSHLSYFQSFFISVTSNFDWEIPLADKRPSLDTNCGGVAKKKKNSGVTSFTETAGVVGRKQINLKKNTRKSSKQRFKKKAAKKRAKNTCQAWLRSTFASLLGLQNNIGEASRIANHLYTVTL